jgi:4-amino-4-deoxy-L-arabinose transferase-like glycosyltransferase
VSVNAECWQRVEEMNIVENRRRLSAEEPRERLKRVDRAAYSVGTEPAPGPQPQADAEQGTTERALLLFALVSGVITHGYHMFQYPLYITDEGVYMQRAWSFIREGTLSPYTYTYDHAPAGWLMIAAWVVLLPHQFQAFGTAENAGRVLMLLVHLANVFLLFQVTRRLSGSLAAAVVATFLFNFSPLAIFYDREVVLDNLMVFWVLVSLSLATRRYRRVVTLMLSGLALGIGILVKENAIFFIPGLAYLLYVRYRTQVNRRFAMGLSAYLAASVVSLYFLYAVLKNELLPVNLNFSLTAPPGGHVALLYTIWQQLHRNQGSLLNTSSPVFQFSVGAWLPKDAFLLVGGTASALVNLAFGLRDRQSRQGTLGAGLLAGGYLLYLARGSVILEFYVVPLVPFLAMNMGLAASRLLPLVAGPSRFAHAAVVGIVFVTLLSPVGGYLITHNSAGKIAVHDLYKLDLTDLQAQELQYVRQHIPPNSRIIMDEEFWVDLHDIPPRYPYAVSHFEATGDPAIRDTLFQQNYQNVDYIVMSNKMLVTMHQADTGQYTWIFDMLANHAQRVWMLQHGGIELEIWQVQH